MRILVAYGSKRGGTEGLARTIADTLRRSGHEVDLRPARAVDEIDDYEAVVVGGALYEHRWHRAARRFVDRHVVELRRVPVWLFSSGPLDDSAGREDIAPTKQVARLMAKVGARAHATFGGRLMPDTGGLAGAIVNQGRGGDWRDMDAVARWTLAIGEAVAKLPRTDRRPAPAARPRARKAMAALCLFTGITAMTGGAALLGVFSPLGTAPPTSVLEHSPFRDFVIPGLLLALVIGLGSFVSGVLAIRRHRAHEPMGFASGAALLVWIVAQMTMLRTTNELQLGYLAIALATLALASWLLRDRFQVRARLSGTPRK